MKENPLAMKSGDVLPSVTFSELKPCPFCGNTELMLGWVEGWRSVRCPTCHATVESDAEDPKETWNRRENAEVLERQYAALLSAFAKQERTMKKVAAKMREYRDRMYALAGEVPGDKPYCAPPIYERLLPEWADELDPREPVAEADAAEKFSQACEERKRS